jgi:hypothetical protein
VWSAPFELKKRRTKEGEGSSMAEGCRVCGRMFKDRHAMESHYGKMHGAARVTAENLSFFCLSCKVLINGDARDAHELLHRKAKGKRTRDDASEIEGFDLMTSSDDVFEVSEQDATMIESRFFYLEQEAKLEAQRAVVQSDEPGFDILAGTWKEESEEQVKEKKKQVRDATVMAFGQMCVKHSVSHRLGNALLRFMTNPLYDPAVLPRDLRTLHKRFDLLLKTHSRVAVQVLFYLVLCPLKYY